MKFKNKIILLISILIIALIVILIIIANLINNNESSNSSNITQNETENNLTENVIIDDENVVDTNNIDDDYIFYHEDETGMAEYSREGLNTFEFNIIDIPNELQSYINNINDFNMNIKEYIYKNGLVQASVAKYENYQVQETNVILITFSLNDENKTNLFVKINFNDNSMQISDNY